MMLEFILDLASFTFKFLEKAYVFNEIMSLHFKRVSPTSCPDSMNILFGCRFLFYFIFLILCIIIECSLAFCPHFMNNMHEHLIRSIH